MAALSSTLLTFARPDSAAVKPPAPPERAQLEESSQRFTGALASALDAQAAAQASASGAVAPPSSVAAANPADAQERARRTLDLGESAPSEPSSGGDLVLDGLQKLRGVVNDEQAKMQAAVDNPDKGANSLMNAQIEIANYSMLLTVTSKLAGQSTQALDTLLKGQ